MVGRGVSAVGGLQCERPWALPCAVRYHVVFSYASGNPALALSDVAIPEML